MYKVTLSMDVASPWSISSDQRFVAGVTGH